MRVRWGAEEQIQVRERSSRRGGGQPAARRTVPIAKQCTRHLGLLIHGCANTLLLLTQVAHSVMQALDQEQKRTWFVRSRLSTNRCIT